MTVASVVPGGFEVTVTVSESRALLALVGEVDLATAPELAALLEVAMDLRRDVVIDLARLDFMDASGLGVLAPRAERLRASGGLLTVRSPPSLVARIFEITGVMDLFQVQARESSFDDLGASGVSDPAERLRSATAIPTADDLVDGALGVIVALAQAAVGGADGVSVSLWRSGRLATVAASNDTVLEMDYHQYETGEGPCLQASIEGQTFHLRAIDEEIRWPAFTPRAHDLGISAILSSPLLVDGRAVGALNLYSRAGPSFSGEDEQLAATFAAETSMLLGGNGAQTANEQFAQRLSDALRTREVIAQAEGVMMQRAHLSADEAYTFLRTCSQRTDIPLRELASDIVASARSPVPPHPDPGNDDG